MSDSVRDSNRLRLISNVRGKKPYPYFCSGVIWVQCIIFQAMDFRDVRSDIVVRNLWSRHDAFKYLVAFVENHKEKIKP